MRHIIGSQVLAAGLILALVTGACTSDDSGQTQTSSTPASPSTVVSATEGTTTSSSAAPTTSSTTTTSAGPVAEGFPVEVASEAGPVTIADQPSRIAALSSVFVEMLFAMGAGDQVVAGDLFSNYPPEANELEKVDAFNLNLEAVIALDPDLVVLSFDPGGAVDGLSAVGIPTLQYGTPVTLDDAYEQMAALGGSVGRSAEAAELIAAVRQRIEGAIDGVGDDFAGVSYYLETDPFTFYTPNSSSFLGQIFGLLGMVNIADAAPDEFGSGFPQLSPEFIIAANPDVIFLASFGETGDTLAARDGWDTMSAVDRGAVLLLDPDVASRWGPRVAELVEAVTGGMVSLVR